MSMDFSTRPEFSWVPFYEELADRIAGFRSPAKQLDLIRFLEQLRRDGLPIMPLEDKDEAGQRFLLKEIDPFTFLASFNRGLSDDKRRRIADRMREFFGVGAATPQGFGGIPVVSNLNSWFFNYQPHRQPDDVARLWDVFEAALLPDPLNNPNLGTLFDRALEVRNVNLNLTMGLFWVRPRWFLSLDGTLRACHKIKLPREGLNYDFYSKTVQSFRDKFSKSFPELSLEAWSGSVTSPGSVPAPPAPPPQDVEYWLVGANWDGDDQTERFLAEAIWENGYKNKYLDVVRQMKTGDRIAIKSVSTQRHGLPFANRDKTVSRMSIKARGTVLRNRGDGRRVEVEWEESSPQKEWYFYTFRQTVWHVRKDVNLAQRLIRFAFFDEPQDHAYFVNKWWGPGEDTGRRDENFDDDSDKDPPYDIEDALAEGAFLRREEFERIVSRLQDKKAIILQGAPGVGKTFIARKLAYLLLQARDDAHVDTVQFHPAYSYEDFVRGYRPTDEAGKFLLKDGPFLKLCEKAAEDPDRPHVLIIDEINRGHLSQIFGELFMLLEADKRGPNSAVIPLYRRHDEERFSVPENLYVIGTMNLADRSLALVDFALRRRFAFITLEPQFSNPGFAAWLRDREMPDEVIDSIVRRMNALNGKLKDDQQLGAAFRIGHSFFCHRGDDFSKLGLDWFHTIVDTEIVPLLEEYWYDAPEKVESAARDLRA